MSDEKLCADGRFPHGALLRCDARIVVADRCARHAESYIANLYNQLRAAEEKYEILAETARQAVDATSKEKRIECLAFARWYELREMLLDGEDAPEQPRAAPSSPPDPSTEIR